MKAPKNTGYLSTVGGLETPPALSIVLGRKTPPALSIVDGPQTPPALSIVKIEEKRRRAGIPTSRMLAEARVNEKSWGRARRDLATVRASTLQRLNRALDRLVIGERAVPNQAAIAKFYLFAVTVVAERCGASTATALAMATDFTQEKPNEEGWLIGARVRRIAMYLVACEWQLGNAALANAIGCSRQNVMQAIKSIEQLREAEPALDVLIAGLPALAGGA